MKDAARSDYIRSVLVRIDLVDGAARWSICGPMSRDPQSKEPLSRPRVDRLIRCAGTRGYCEIERKLRRNRGFLATTVAYDIERVPKLLSRRASCL